MATIQAIVRHGKIEVDKPVPLPDGTELTIPIPDLTHSIGLREEEWSDTPEAIDDWIRWYDSLEPLEFTAEERAAWDRITRSEC